MGKIGSIGFTYLVTRCYGRTNTCFRHSRSNYGYSWRFLIVDVCFYLNISIYFKFYYIYRFWNSFFAATTGLFQNDMKSYCIYTCSQLGYMILHVGYLVMKWVFFIYQTMHFSKLYYFRCWFHTCCSRWARYEKNGWLKIYCPSYSDGYWFIGINGIPILADYSKTLF
jgi:hypothetical protein